MRENLLAPRAKICECRVVWLLPVVGIKASSFYGVVVRSKCEVDVYVETQRNTGLEVVYSS